jgi:hypothetical protein
VVAPNRKAVTAHFYLQGRRVAEIHVIKITKDKIFSVWRIKPP